MSESVESLLEFLRISSRVAVVQLEPPRARAFADALQLAMEFGEARVAKLREEARADLELARAIGRADVVRLTREEETARAAAVHWESVAAANAMDVVTEVAAERERCAVTVESVANTNAMSAGAEMWVRSSAAAIRARGLRGTPQLDDVKLGGA